MREFFDKVPLVVVLFIVVSVVRALVNAVKSSKPAEPQMGGAEENDEQRRVREIQERIRRIGAERRGHGAPMHPPVQTAPPVFQPPPIAPVDPFGGPLKRKLAEIERRLQPKPVVTPPLLAHPSVAQVERRQRLEEEAEDLAEKKFLAARHAQHLAEAQAAVAQSELGLRTSARARLLEDLREPQSLRRAVVLREVLGAPVGLR